METEDLKPGMLVRVKSGKLYKIHGGYQTSEPLWGFKAELDAEGKLIWEKVSENISRPRGSVDKTRVHATQWQVNEKHPQGRLYQASRELKVAEIEPV